MHDAPLAYFITWTTYGTWLPGDDRGWVKWQSGFQQPDPLRMQGAQLQLQECEFYLQPEERHVVESTIREHCDIRNWHLYAVHVRTNHLHVVLSAREVNPDDVVVQLKAWSTRRLKEHAKKKGYARQNRERWWTEGASKRWINREADLEASILYVRDGQDKAR